MGCDITFRAVTEHDAAALAHVLVTTNNSNYRGIVPDQCLTFTEAESASNWRRKLRTALPDSDAFLLAEHDGAVVAYAWGGLSDADPRIGVIRQIMVLPSHQRTGLGRMLVRQVASHLIDQGVESIRVEVLRMNPCRPFYERLGARYVSERPFDWDGTTLSMCTYAWDDPRALAR